MISEENLAQLRALIESALNEHDKTLIGLIEQVLDRRNLKRSPDKTAAERMRKYRAKNRNVTSRTKRNASEGKAVTLRNGGRNGKHEEMFVMPEWLKPHEDLWEEWIRARVKIKKPPTEFAKRMAAVRLLRLVDAGGNVRQILAEAALHNWQDFYVTKD